MTSQPPKVTFSTQLSTCTTTFWTTNCTWQLLLPSTTWRWSTSDFTQWSNSVCLPLLTCTSSSTRQVPRWYVSWCSRITKLEECTSSCTMIAWCSFILCYVFISSLGRIFISQLSSFPSLWELRQVFSLLYRHFLESFSGNTEQLLCSSSLESS